MFAFCAGPDHHVSVGIREGSTEGNRTQEAESESVRSIKVNSSSAYSISSF